eukprot:1397048-Prymnesium_polylepis.1
MSCTYELKSLKTLRAFGAHKTKKLILANTTSKWCSYWRRDPPDIAARVSCTVRLDSRGHVHVAP